MTLCFLIESKISWQWKFECATKLMVQAIYRCLRLSAHTVQLTLGDITSSPL